MYKFSHLLHNKQGKKWQILKSCIDQKNSKNQTKFFMDVAFFVYAGRSHAMLEIDWYWVHIFLSVNWGKKDTYTIFSWEYDPNSAMTFIKK